MTITQTIGYIKEHPYYQLARTDEKAMEKLLFELSLHVWLVSSGNCAKAYRQNKRMNSPQIIEAIRDCEPPCNLDLRLPFVQVPVLVAAEPECFVAVLPRSRVRRVSYCDARQLSLWA